MRRSFGRNEESRRYTVSRDGILARRRQQLVGVVDAEGAAGDVGIRAARAISACSTSDRTTVELTFSPPTLNGSIRYSRNVGRSDERSEP